MRRRTSAGRGLTRTAVRHLIEQGASTSRTLMSQQDKIWSRYSRDKVDIGETLARVLRTLAKVAPLVAPSGPSRSSPAPSRSSACSRRAFAGDSICWTSSRRPWP